MMSRLSPLRAIGFTMVVLLLAACASSPMAVAPPATVTPPAPTVSPMPPAATPHPFEGLAEWDVVVIGDSTLWWVAEPYAKLIEQDRGVRVNLHDEWQGGLSADTILKALRGDSGQSLRMEKWPQLIRDAEVLVLFGNPMDSLAPEMLAATGNCLSSLDPGAVSVGPDAFAPYVADLDAIYGGIARLRAGRPLVFRPTGIYNPVISRWREKGIADVCGALWDGLNDAARQVAEKHGARFVDTYGAFNGPAHDQDPRTKGLIREDGEHPSEAGAQFYAGLLQQSGYDTWVARHP